MTASADVAAQGLSWYETTVASKREPIRLTFDLDVDVCVIGGGLAGLTTARELARRNWSVAVLEARSVGWNASGRNCGFVLPGFAETMENIASRVGVEHARAMWELSDAGRMYVRDTIAETRMPGVEPVDGWLHVSRFAEDFGYPAHVSELRNRYGADVDAWSTEQVRAVLRSPVYFNAVHYRTAFHIHPLNYVLGLAAAAERAGVRIFEETPALEIDPAGVRKRVTTPSARVRAAHVVLAGNVHLGSLQPQLAGTVMPLTTFVSVTAPIGERLREIIGYAGAVSDGPRADNHYRVVAGDRLLWAGGMRTWAADARPFARRLRADLARTYPQLADVEIEQVWSGTLGRTVHRMPQIGELAPGLWVASGFGGHGLNTTAMAGLLIARAIAESDTSWHLFQPYELVWAGGIAGRAVVQAGYSATRLRDQARTVMARWRHVRGWPKAIETAGGQTTKADMAAIGASDLTAHADKPIPTPPSRRRRQRIKQGSEVEAG